MIKIHRSTDKQFYYTVHAKNGKVLVTSETMKQLRSIYNGIDSLFDAVFKKKLIVEKVWEKKKASTSPNKK
jgi:uncharacterized protein YegP (UPF0339 family)